MSQLSDLMADRPLGNVLDVVVLFGRGKALLGAFLKRPVETRGKPGGAYQARGIFHKRIILQYAEHLGFDIGDAVKWIEQKPARTFIQRERHGVHGKVAASQIFLNAGRGYNWRLADLFVVFGVRHADFGAHIAGQQQEQGLDVFVLSDDLCSGAFKVFLQLKRIALDGEIEVADGKAADDVADGAAGQIERNARRAGYILHEVDALHLVRRQPDFHGVNVISHSYSNDQSSGRAEGCCTWHSDLRFPQHFHRTARHTPWCFSTKPSTSRSI